MSAEHIRTALKFSYDERLLAGIRGALEHVASRHGLTDGERAEMLAAAEKTCRRCFEPFPTSNSSCTVIIDDYDDHVEVSVDLAGRARENFVTHFHKNPTHP